MASFVYDSFYIDISSGYFALDVNALYMLLVNSSYTPNKAQDARLTAVTGEIAGANGYTEGGLEVIPTIGVDAEGRAYATFPSMTFPNADFGMRGAVIYQRMGGPPSPGDPLLCYVDFGEDVEAANTTLDLIFTAPMGLQVAYPDPLDGYIDFPDVPGYRPLRLKASTQTCATPTLREREIALNEADGVLYTRDAEGVAAATPYMELVHGGWAPDAGEVGQVLRADGVWVDPLLVYDAPVQLGPPQSARVVLADAVLDDAVAAPIPDTIYYRPFYLSKPTDFEQLAVVVIEPAEAQLAFGLSTWTPNSHSPGTLISAHTVVLSVAGEHAVSVDIRLEAGWYAAFTGVVGAAGGTLAAASAPLSLAADFTLVGDYTAPYPLSGTLDPLPQPTGNAPAAWAILQGDTV